MGPGGAGHYIKMVHNGIEYADMQLIAEIYDLLHRGAGLSNLELAKSSLSGIPMSYTRT
jgi:6-phosphogluconate dehydrogenase